MGNRHYLISFIVFILIFLSIFVAQANPPDCVNVMLGGRLNPFSFPTHIDNRFQLEMKRRGLSDDIIKQVNRYGLGSYDPRDGSRHTLFDHPLTSNWDHLILFNIYDAAAAAIDQARAQPGSHHTNIWDVVRAVEFHEVLHQINHNFSLVTKPFRAALGERSQSALVALSEAVDASYFHMKDAFRSATYNPSKEANEAEKVEFVIEELLVTLIWEEALYKNVDRVLDSVNSNLMAAGQSPIAKDRMLEFIRGEAKEYLEEAERTLYSAKFFAKRMDNERMAGTPEIHAEIQRFAKPVSRSRLTHQEISALELEPIFKQFGYNRIAGTMMRDSRLLEPVLNDNSELLSRREAIADLDLTPAGSRTGKRLGENLMNWNASSQVKEVFTEQSVLRELYTNVEVDADRLKFRLGLSEHTSATAADLKNLGYFQVTALFNEMVRLNDVLRNYRLGSKRLQAIQFLAQSVIDPQNPYGLQSFFASLMSAKPHERNEIMKSLVDKKWSELQLLKTLYREVSFLITLSDLGTYIGGTTFAELLDPKTNPPTINLNQGSNPTLVYHYTYGEQKNSGKKVTPNSLVPFENAIGDFGGKSSVKAMVIYGANEKGKSTFLRTVGQLVVLASLGVKVPVQSMTLTPIPVYSALNSGDSLVNGLSHHAADITAVNAVVSAVQKNPYALILVDELATGTIQEGGNATEVAYLEWFIQQGALTLLATHRLTTPNLTSMMDKIIIATASNYTLKVGSINPEALIEGSVNSLREHGTPPEIVARAQQIVRTRKATINRRRH